MTDQKSYFGFLGFRKNEEGSVASFASSRDLDDVRALLLSSDSPERAGNEPEKRQADPAAAGPEKSLARMMAKIVDSSHSQSELLSISTFLLPAYVGVMIDREIVVPTQKLDSIVEDAANITIYGLSEEMFRRLPAKRERLDRVERGLEALPAALLMSIVATFDSNISDVVREMLTLKSDAFQTGTKTILLSEALQADSRKGLSQTRFTSFHVEATRSKLSTSKITFMWR
jgi:hypothetical protein